MEVSQKSVEDAISRQRSRWREGLVPARLNQSVETGRDRGAAITVSSATKLKQRKKVRVK